MPCPKSPGRYCKYLQYYRCDTYITVYHRLLHFITNSYSSSRMITISGPQFYNALQIQCQSIGDHLIQYRSETPNEIDSARAVAMQHDAIVVRARGLGRSWMAAFRPTRPGRAERRRAGLAATRRSSRIIDSDTARGGAGHRTSRKGEEGQRKRQCAAAPHRPLPPRRS